MKNLMPKKSLVVKAVLVVVLIALLMGTGYILSSKSDAILFSITNTDDVMFFRERVALVNKTGETWKHKTIHEEFASPIPVDITVK